MSRLFLKVTGPEKDSLGTNSEMHFDANGGTIGRAQSNSWALPDPACYMSSQHALISFQNDKFYITDLSSNGTYINGQDTAIGKNNTACFDDINSLTMGPYTVSVEQQAEPTSIDNAQAGSLTAMFAPQEFDSPPPPVQPAQTADFNNAADDSAADPLALLGGDPAPVTDFPEDWASEDSAVAPSNFNQQELTPNDQINDAFVPPQPKPAASSNSAPELPPENWDDTMFTPAALQDISQPAPSSPPEPAETSTTQSLEEKTDTAGSEIPNDPDFFGKSAAPAAAASPAANISTSAPTPSDLDDVTLVGPNTHDSAPSSPLETPQPERPDAQAFSPVAQTPREPSGATTDILKPAPGGKPAPSTASAGPATSTTLGDMPVAEATFRANGLDPELLKDPEFIDQAIAVLPYFLEGTLNTLQSRAQIKNELRASKTIFQAIDNNPLKYSVNKQDAIQNLFTHRRPGFLAPNDAIKEAFVDIGQHETALVAGIQGGLNGLLNKIKPETIEQRIEANESKKNLFGKISSSKKWDFYKETYSHITDNSGDSFLELFGNDFLNAYEAHINQKDKDGK